MIRPRLGTFQDDIFLGLLSVCESFNLSMPIMLSDRHILGRALYLLLAANRELSNCHFCLTWLRILGLHAQQHQLHDLFLHVCSCFGTLIRYLARTV